MSRPDETLSEIVKRRVAGGELVRQARKRSGLRSGTAAQKMIAAQQETDGHEAARKQYSGFTGRWIGVDLDGTLAYQDYNKYKFDKIGPPIQPMVDLVNKLLDEGKEVRIFTARISRTMDEGYIDVLEAIQRFCRVNFKGRELVVTNKKDFGCEVIYDNRAITVETNTGRLINGSKAETMLRASIAMTEDEETKVQE